MIDLKNITFSYEGEKALDEITLHFDPGKCYCIEGPNGCGKSTLFRIINGLSFPEQGTYIFNGEEITEKKLKNVAFAAEFHKNIGFLFQNPEVQLFSKTVEDELAFGPMQLGWEGERIKAQVEMYLSLMHLDRLRHRAPFHMSGGEKKRTALASILIMEPKVLILDEPVSGLDEDSENEMIKLLQGLKTPDRLIIIATHKREVAESLADKFIYMNKDHQVVN